MPRFEVSGRGKDTGRKRKRVYVAASQALAVQQAESDGTQVDDVIELPQLPPSDAQIAYAKQLGLALPDKVTQDEVSDLISVKTDSDKPAEPRHKAFASLYGVEFTQYIGKKLLFDKIQAALVEPGREKEMLSWFTFRVYREVMAGAYDAPIDSPADPVIEAIAEELLQQPDVIKSARRYEGRDLIWFGQWTSRDGFPHQGGSNRTTAYKAAAALLRKRVKSHAISRPASPVTQVRTEGPAVPNPPPVQVQKKPESKGCLGMLCILAILPAGFLYLVKHVVSAWM
ncbi:hypothetical protein [Aeromonas sp. ARM81]|uniref:hypothetical protein n=1 Tax=Aeromonas sp. ARM81 TaxID=1747384 RepID=UPI0011C07666|nr:hypothetical protein [Aeromonas sp. ARM81]